MGEKGETGEQDWGKPQPQVTYNNWVLRDYR
jgi:hypothetical protein